MLACTDIESWRGVSLTSSRCEASNACTKPLQISISKSVGKPLTDRPNCSTSGRLKETMFATTYSIFMNGLRFCERKYPSRSPCPLNPLNISVVACLLYTSDAADDLLCVDLGGRRIIK